MNNLILGFGLSWATVFIISCSAPTREPDGVPGGVPIINPDDQMTRFCDSVSGICVQCRRYPIRNLDGSLSHVMELCR